VDANAVLAVLGGVIIAAVVRLANVVGAWLAKVLGVTPPDPIVAPGADRNGGSG